MLPIPLDQAFTFCCCSIIAAVMTKSSETAISSMTHSMTRRALPSASPVARTPGSERTSLFKCYDSSKLEAVGGLAASAATRPYASAHTTFELSEFSSGYLSLPPRAKKQMEEANNHEIFSVVCEHSSTAAVSTVGA
jgi:hypothetical protein